MKKSLKTFIIFIYFSIIYLPLLAYDDEIDYRLSDFNFNEFLIGIAIGGALILLGIWIKSLSEKNFFRISGNILITIGIIIALMVIIQPLYAILTILFQIAIVVAIIGGIIYLAYKHYTGKKEEEINNNSDEIDENNN